LLGHRWGSGFGIGAGFGVGGAGFGVGGARVRQTVVQLKL
jgi:hypothetical protein